VEYNKRYPAYWMNDTINAKNRPSALSDSHSDESLQESRVNDRYIPLLSSCFITLKNIRLYPINHQQVKHSIEQAYKALSKELKDQDPLVFGVAKDVLIFNEVQIGPGIPALDAFAMALSKHDIVSLTFHKGIVKKSLICFFQLLCDSFEIAAGEEGIQQELITRGGSHIDLLTIDYHLFKLSAEGGKDVTGATVRKGRRGNMWLTFTRRLLRGAFNGKEAGDDGGSSDGDGQLDAAVDPVQLAHFINENKLAISSNLRNYGVMLDGILGSMVEGIGKKAIDSAAGQRSVAPDPLDAEEISMVVTMLNELNPALRKQFLATTLDKCQGNQDKKSNAQLLSGLSSTLVLEMLDVANEADREISPSLISLIQGLSSSKSAADGNSSSALASHEVKTLMAREKYENYVEPEYDELLQTLGQSQKQVEAPIGFVLKEQEKTMEENYLVDRVTHLILLLMEETDKAEVYVRYGQKLIEIALELPSIGNFTLIETITGVLSRHTKSHSSPVIQEFARDCLDRIEGREYLESIAAFLPDASGQERDLAVQALMVRGAKAVSELLDFYCEEKDEQIKEKVNKYFQKHRVETLAEIVRRISREKRDKTLLLLALIKDLGVGGAAPLLRPVLTHYDESVRMSALRILLSLQDQEAVQYLKDMLHSSDDTVVTGAMALAAQYKTAALIPDLVELFNYRCLGRGAIEQNSKIILVLGSIADPAALPALEKLVDSNWIFYSKQVAEMKKTLFLSLSKYPADSVISLCKKGLKSDQQRIRKTCREILSHAAGRKQ
jgi:HEAT repeat protein